MGQTKKLQDGKFEHSHVDNYILLHLIKYK